MCSHPSSQTFSSLLSFRFSFVFKSSHCLPHSSSSSFPISISFHIAFRFSSTSRICKKQLFVFATPMADHAESPYAHPHPHQRLVSDVDTAKPQTKPNPPSKFFSYFLSKSVLVGILLVLLPLFPSQAPEFVNQTILTRSWELVHLLFVGIAVSYGLFSRRNVENEKENNSKFDSTQSYMSRILQVSSVFDDEIDNPSSSGSDENKIQTWNSQYCRGNSTVVVAETGSLLDEHNRTISSSNFSSNEKSSHKPLLLPVRSLRSQVPKVDETKPVRQSSGLSSGSLSRSGSGVKIPSQNSLGRTRSGEKMGGLDPSVLEEKLKENVVLPSPIPWRSRSGRFELKDDVGGGGGGGSSGGGGGTPPSYTVLPPSVGESEVDRVNSFVRPSTIPWSSRPNSTSPSPRKLSPAPSFSSEVQAKNSEDSGKRRGYYKSSPPPPPPPPPPMLHKSPPMVPSYRSNADQTTSTMTFGEEGYNSARSFQNELKDFSRSKREGLPPSRMNVSSSVRDSAKPEAKSRHNSFDGSSSLLGKSVRTVRSNDQIHEYERTRDVEPVHGGGSKAEVFERNSFYDEKTRREVSPPKPPIFSKYPKEEKKKQIFEHVLADSDEEGTDFETNASQGNSDAEESIMHNSVSEASPPNPNEVDKKADEFIAKFREQIRLQRIDSIKRTSGKKSVMRTSTR
ncbi:uncharacterized protein LOC113330025 [Papaver somniferum]|uniref:uncharacterized protein LOC113330025 n=1 Tax=Papaver somniferum TaxID=3469 RepID=UPI000E6FF212|nr:uncharacterized protein LOC113330025 [Papaver somniferum]